MNKNKIQNYDDLLEEKKRLEAICWPSKKQISTNWVEMKKEFEPINNVISFFSKLTTRDKSNPLSIWELTWRVIFFSEKFYSHDLAGPPGWWFHFC